MTDPNLARLDAEHWLANRLRADATIFAGATDRAIRVERFRRRIFELGWANRRAGYRGEDPETFAELFERLLGEPLFTNAGEKNNAET
jgi:hypothetical protein